MLFCLCLTLNSSFNFTLVVGEKKRAFWMFVWVVMIIFFLTLKNKRYFCLYRILGFFGFDNTHIHESVVFLCVLWRCWSFNEVTTILCDNDVYFMRWMCVCVWKFNRDNSFRKIKEMVQWCVTKVNWWEVKIITRNSSN